MTKRIVSYVVLASMLIGMLAGFGTPAFATPLSTSAVNLKVNALEAPLGIDTPTPEFSWNMESNLIGQAQASYHLVVAKDSAFTQVVWDSGLVTSDKSLDILYGSSGSAQALVAETDYYWKVTLTDAFGQQVPSLTARFSTGLMSTDTTINNTSRPAWNDAEFIGSSINTLDALTTAMYTVALQFQFMEGQRVFSFIFGADDPRLANSSLNVYGAPGGESFIRVEIDARTLPATFSIYRVGYDATDDMYGDPNVIPYKTGALGANVITADNISNVHTLSIGVNQSNVTISVNGTAAPTAYSSQIATSVSQLSDGRRPGQNNNNNVTPNMRVAQNGSYSFSTGNNYNGFPNLCSIGFQVNNPGDVVRVGSLTVTDQLQGSTRLFDTASGHGNVFSVLDGVDVVANDNITITGSATNAGVPLYTDPSHDSINYLRTEFQAEKAIAGAKLYATAMGGYEMFINGGRVGKDWFAPGLTQYRSVMNYNTYDVTELVKVGANAIAAIVGDGFWSGLMTFTPGNGNFWGARQGIMAKLVITYTDGTSKAVVTNKTDWKVYKDGPVRVGSMFQGQRYDANKEVNIAGWDQAGFDMSGWQTPVNITPRATTINPTISAQLDQPVRVAKIETATRAIESRNNPPRGGTAPYVVDPSTYVYDMGTTMTGVPSVTIPAGWLHEGDQVVFRFGEFIYPGNEFAVDFNGDQIQGHPDGYDYDELYGPDGGYHKNAAGKPLYDTYRFALATDVYVASKADETRDVVIEPHFTYRSFRFIQILVPGSTTPLPLNNVKGLSLSSIADPAGAYNATTADGVTGRMANQFFRNTQESQLGNFVSVPTDCPQRNERMGWTGDIQAYSRTATYHALDAQAFLRQWMVSCDADQATNGGLGDTVPVYNVNRPTGNDSSIVWGGAVVMAPWQLYQQYGDLAVVRKHYNNFRGYLNSKDIHPSSTGDTAPYAGLSTQTNGRADHIALDASTVGGEGQRLLCNVLLIYLLDAGAEMADAIGETAQAAAWREWRERAIISWNNAYVDPDTGLTRHMNITNGTLTNHGTPSNSVMDSQSSYAYALDFGIFSDTMTIQAGPNQGMAYKAFAEKRLAELIADPSKSKNGAGTQRNGSYVCYDNPYTVTSGFAATPSLLPALTKSGSNETAYQLFSSTNYASWLYPVSLGSTSMWELWNSFELALGWGGQSSMNSFNHFALGAAGQWLYEYSLGITSAGQAGYKDFVLQPSVGGQFTALEGSMTTNYGVIESAWTARGNGSADANGVMIQANEMTAYSCAVPANTTATLYLPVDEADMDNFNQIYGVTYLGMEEHNGVDCAKLSLFPGGYNFDVTASGLVASHDAAYFVPVQAEINSAAAVGINTPASFTVSLTNANGVGVVTFEFTVDSRYLDFTAATALNGFSILEQLSWEYIGSQMWKGSVKLYNPGFVQTNASIDVLEISGVTLSLLGATTVTLTDIEVTGDVDGFAGTLPSVIVKADAEVSIVSKTVFSKYDLNHDGRIDELDLAIVVYYYLANDLEADWEVVMFDIASAKDCDVAVNGRVDLADMIEVIANYCDSY